MTWFRTTNQQRRYLNIVFFVFGVFLLLKGLEAGLRYYDEHRWDEIRAAKTKELLEDASVRFASFQRDTRRIATDLARNSIVLSALDGTGELVPLFEEIGRISEREDVGAEVYNTRG